MTEKGTVLVDDVAPGLLGRVREVENDAEFVEAADERSASAGQSLRRCLDSSGELVRVVPREARRAHAALMPLLEGGGIARERLGSLHREHEPQTRVVELDARADLADPLDVLLDCAVELHRLVERPFTRFAVRRRRAVERADLDAHPARLEHRQPVALEHARPAAAQNELQRLLLAAARNELEQHVVVRIDDHVRRVLRIRPP